MAKARLIRVLLVDDHVMVRQAVRSFLDSYSNIEVVGEDGRRRGRVSTSEKASTQRCRDGHYDAQNGRGEQYSPHQNLLSPHCGNRIIGSSAKLSADELYGAIKRAVASLHPIVIRDDISVAPKPSQREQAVAKYRPLD